MGQDTLGEGVGGDGGGVGLAIQEIVRCGFLGAPAEGGGDGVGSEGGVFGLAEVFAVAVEEEVLHFVWVHDSAERSVWVFGVGVRVLRCLDHADAARGLRFAAWDAAPHLAEGLSGSDFLGDGFGVVVWIGQLSGADPGLLELFGKVAGLSHYIAACLLGFAEGFLG